jgi:hypothetical protein
MAARTVSNVATYSLGVGRWFRDRQNNGIMEQFGILKNGQGQLPLDDFRVYATERTWAAPSTVGGLYGMDMSSVRVTCQTK